jgi:Flp pilus assembly protein TadG
MRYTSFLSRTNVGQGKLTGRRKGLRRAVAAVELAVLAPFLAFLFVITVDFARVFYYQLTLDDCARNGALLGSQLRSYQETGWVKPYNDIVAVTVADGASLNPPLDPSQVTVTGGIGSDGNPNVTVTIQYPFASITNFPGFGDTLNLQATVSMRVAPPK